jgi:hypothetical protein
MEVRNERLSRDALEYLRELNRAGLPDAERRWLRPALEAFSRQRPDPLHLRFSFSPQQRRSILEACAAGNAEVARRFLGRADGVLFEDMAIEPQYEPYPGLPEATRRQIAAFIASQTKATTS